MLNTLYNVSIVHSKPNEKQKALQQLENAKNKTIEIEKEFKTSEEILKRSKTQRKSNRFNVLCRIFNFKNKHKKFKSNTKKKQ